MAAETGQDSFLWFYLHLFHVNFRPGEAWTMREWK